VLSEASREVGIVVVWPPRQQALCITVGRLGVGECTEFLFGNERRIVGAQTINQRQSKQRTGIILVPQQALLSDFVSSVQRIIESSAVLLVPRDGWAIDEPIIVAEQLAAQNVHAIKFTEQDSTGLGHPRHRIGLVQKFR